MRPVPKGSALFFVWFKSMGRCEKPKKSRKNEKNIPQSVRPNYDDDNLLLRHRDRYFACECGTHLRRLHLQCCCSIEDVVLLLPLLLLSYSDESHHSTAEEAQFQSDDALRVAHRLFSYVVGRRMLSNRAAQRELQLRRLLHRQWHRYCLTWKEWMCCCWLRLQRGRLCSKSRRS